MICRSERKWNKDQRSNSSLMADRTNNGDEEILKGWQQIFKYTAMQTI
jgi:hypothetical protein